MSDKGPPPVPGWRSPDDRERARLEREARRRDAIRPGGGSNTPPPRDSRSAPGAASTPPPRDGGAAPGGTGTPPPRDSAGAQGGMPAGAPLGAPGSARGPGPSGAREDRGVSDGDTPPPRLGGGPTPVDAQQPLGAARGGRAASPRARSKAPTRHKAAGQQRAGGPGRGRSVLRAALLLGLLLVFGAVAFAAYGFVAPSGGGGERVRVSIPKGAGVGDIARTLDERGIVRSAFFFEARTTVSGDRGALKAGNYALPTGADHDRIVTALSAGPAPKKIRTVNVTIPEGRSRREIAPAVADAGLKGSYAKASLRSPALSPRSYGAEGAGSLEGFLFPATYEVRAGASARTLVRKQLQAFEREWDKVDMRRARRGNLTPYEVLIIASMVEREAQVARERPIIASVIYNRLRDDMPLGIDATVRYATRNWTKPLTQSELAIESPYNTRARQGLPPGPIGNPGLASMRAAAKPARSDYRYYVVKPNACGEHVFSSSLAEFTEDSNRYNAERAKRGGRSPTDC